MYTVVCIVMNWKKIILHVSLSFKKIYIQLYVPLLLENKNYIIPFFSIIRRWTVRLWKAVVAAWKICYDTRSLPNPPRQRQRRQWTAMGILERQSSTLSWWEVSDVGNAAIAGSPSSMDIYSMSMWVVMCRGDKIVFSHTKIICSELVYKDHPREKPNVVLRHRWSLYAGSVTWNV